jgi:pathogenesis-related protein 1
MKGIAYALVLASAMSAGCDGEVGGGPMIDASGSGSGSGSGSADATIQGGVGEPTNLTGITLFHNQVRAAVDTTGVAGGPLPMMVWDSDLAAHALAYASMCKDTDAPAGLIDHSTQAYRTNAAGYPYVGENIFGSGGAASAQQAVDTWAGEKANFTYPSGCAGTCGHYTQVVWRTSINLGCANVTCPGLTYGGTILCEYGPGGNSGGAPY